MPSLLSQRLTGIGGHIFSPEKQLSLIWAFQLGQQPKQGAFPAAAFAHNTQCLPGKQLQIHLLTGSQHLSTRPAIPPAQAASL